jgi:hypothetical protein
MKALLALSAVAFAAGCATQGDTQLAQAECKVHPITTDSVTGANRRPTSELDQRWAQAQLAGSDYRMQNLRQNGYNMNNIEDALRECP